MQQGNITSINWGNSSLFSGYISNDNIFAINGEHLGVSLAKFQEIEQALLKCKKRLIELGEIKVPKTPEEIIKEQNELLEKQTLAINALLEKVNGFETNSKFSASECENESITSNTTSSSDGGPVKNTNTGRCAKSNKRTSNPE